MASVHTTHGSAVPSVGVLGFGWGGLLALHAVAWSSHFASAIVVGAPTSESRLGMEMGGPQTIADEPAAAAAAAPASDSTAAPAAADDAAAAAAATSAADASAAGMAAAAEHEFVCALGRARTPTLLLYGDADPSCPISHAQIAYTALQHGSPHSSLVVYPGEDQSLQLPSYQADACRRMCEWCTLHQPGAMPPPPAT